MLSLRRQVWGLTLVCLLGFAISAHADGNAELGSKTFRKCTACHMIVSENGAVIVKGGKLGPNLYDMIGRQAATVQGFNYGKSLKLAGENGLVWNEENFIAYVRNPRQFLEAYLESFRIQNKMAYKLPKGAADIYAYLKSLGPSVAEKSNN